MDRVTGARIGLWVFTAGIFAWIFPNIDLDLTANAVTDVVIVVFGVLAAVGLPRAVDGLGTRFLRIGLVGVAVGQFAQNAVSAVSGLDGTNTAPVLVVVLGAIAVIVGAARWREDGWDLDALAWLAIGFAGFAFEPVYYLILTLVTGDSFSGYLPGILLVGTGAVLCAWSFWAARDEA